MSESYNNIFCEVSAQEINNNNIQDKEYSPYSFYHDDKSSSSSSPSSLSTLEEYKRPDAPKQGSCVCDLCFKSFQSFSLLYKHKAKLCWEDLSEELINPIRICFSKEHLRWIGDTLEKLNIPVLSNADGSLFIIVDEVMVEITMRRLYVSQITKYNLEEWYPALDKLSEKLNFPNGLTPKTTILSLDDDELKLIKGLCSVVLARNMGMSSRETQKELTQREQLEDRINSTVFSSPHTYFCKLSTRSPKDSVSTKIKDEDKGEDLQEKIKNKMEQMKTHNAEEAIGLITKSQRIFSDISMYFQYRVSGSSSGYMSLIFREWRDMRPDHEFRCFVKGHKLVAISQYNCYSIFPFLQDYSYVLSLRDSILSFHDLISLGGGFSMPDYVMDIVVYPQVEKDNETTQEDKEEIIMKKEEKEKYECQLIEVNPFGAYMSSGAGLFHWKKDYDLLHGLLPLSKPPIRVLKALI